MFALSVQSYRFPFEAMFCVVLKVCVGVRTRVCVFKLYNMLCKLS